MAAVPFAEFITGLPRADIPFPGVTGWISQAADHQVVFLEIEPIGPASPHGNPAGGGGERTTTVGAHSHGEQWGIVVEGEMELTVGDVTRTYRAGDSYHIPAGVVHGATFRTKVRAIDVFAEPDRYRPIV